MADNDKAPFSEKLETGGFDPHDQILALSWAQ